MFMLGFGEIIFALFALGVTAFVIFIIVKLLKRPR